VRVARHASAADPPGREDELLDHALEIAKGGGFGALTMKKVADRVGFTEAAAYRYFPTKQALVVGIMKRLRAMFLDVVHRIADDESLAPATRLERIVRHHVDFIVRTNGLPVLFLAEAAAGCDRRVVGRLRGITDEYLDVLEALVARAAPPRSPVRPREKALLLFGIAAVTAVRLRLGERPKALDAVASDLVPFVIRSITR
jgi:AcrR family transcriptional regulator